jgi:uncharacterized protein YecT (DUF1311 family)
MRHTAIVAASLLFVLAACNAMPARAATDCAQASQADMNACAAQAYRREDVQLNLLYKQLVGLSSRSEVAKLKRAQTAWIAFRDLHCRYDEGRYEGGSMAPLVGFTCLRNLTRQRNETLQALIKDVH